MSAAQFDRPLRVIQWTTGNIGRRSAHAILSRPDLELVGVYAHGADKIGADAASVVPRLLEELDDPGARTRAAAADSLVKFDATGLI